ncbi:MAG: methyltransferase domain-containing protein [Candidatus Marinimicrobia bacterium]|nr:methyltransferase domain-containing protein [Candidatus Neomarinimicrobiota bacterium]
MSYKEDHPQFWEDIYLLDDAGWDLGGPTPVFAQIGKEITPGKICIVGCGRGHDAIMFAKKGFHVTAIDFAPSAIKAVNELALEANVKIDAIQIDLFSMLPKFNNTFDYVVEQTCFCAIQPKQREDYAHVVHSILKSGGLLIGLWFPLDKTMEEGGPPWATSIQEVKSLFNHGWEIEKEEWPDLSISPRKDREKLIIFQKD